MKTHPFPLIPSLLAAAAMAVLSGSATAAEAKEIDISQHGAVGDGKTLNSKSIQATIDECGAAGGGTLVIPRGVFLSGALFLKPGVNIQFLEGGVLKGSTDINDYPKQETRIEGHFEPWRVALINGNHVDHLRITGPGTLDGSGAPFWQEFYQRRREDHKTTNLNVERPRLAFIQNSQDVQVSGIRFMDSGFWNLHLYRCGNVTVEDCRFEALHSTKPANAPSSDGIDVDSSQDVTISKCFFAVGDDCIALKGSKGPFAMDDKDSPPVERIHIRDSVFEAGGGIVTFGSEATIVRDVVVERCRTTKPTVLRLKLRPDTPQHYENIRLSEITVEGGGLIFKVLPWSQYFDLKGQAPPKSVVRNITISGLKGSFGSFGSFDCGSQVDVSNVVLKDVDVSLKDTGFEPRGVRDLKFENVRVNGKSATAPLSAR